MKLCSKCGKNPRVLDKNKSRACYCKPCWVERSKTWNKKNKDRYRNNQLKRKFGITLDEYHRLLHAQGGVCAICKEPCNSGRALAVDHNHKTLQNRGLLCGNCNRGIGNLRESPAIMQRAIDYINRYAREVQTD